VQISPKDVPPALIHLYRGELGRMTTYRVRLDTTTNWAVGTTAAVITFAIGSRELPHYVFGLPVVLNLVFLWIEARRFRTYEMIRRRVRLLEQGFYMTVLGGEPRPNWEQQLADSLKHPTAPIGYVQAFSVRLRRNYLWLLLVVYIGWLVKLDAAGPVPDAAMVGRVSGRIVLAMVGLAILALGALGVVHRPAEEG
jgi:uncharacterized membrane protein